MIKKDETKIKIKTICGPLTLNTKLVECGFCFNQRFRDFFFGQTGIKNFKFNADMVATSKKVKQDNDLSFTLEDMLNVYYGKKEYAKYDKSSCQWNKFLKDFCADANSNTYSNKLRVAAILWKEVRDSPKLKVYTKDLLELYKVKIKELK